MTERVVGNRGGPGVLSKLEQGGLRPLRDKETGFRAYKNLILSNVRTEASNNCNCIEF